jgi:hypothetical protein
VRLALLVTIAVAACGGEELSCPNDLPACPSPAPSYSADVAPLVQRRCAPCHFPGGTAAEHNLATYDRVFAQRGIVLNQIYTCRMPPDAPLVGEERTLFLEWLECDAPNN